MCTFGLIGSRLFRLQVLDGARYAPIAEDNRYSIAGYTTLDAMVSYEVRRLRLRLNLRNLTGTEYATRGFGSVSAIPARPFEASLRAELGFGRR